MDRVQELAEAIARLRPGEKEQLFELLAARGDLPEPYHSPALEEEGLELHFSTSQPDWRPDYLLVFDGGSRGNPGWGYGSYAITRVQDGAQRVSRLHLGNGYTNNEAEYDSLIAALEDLTERIEQAGRQPEEFTLEVRGDSALVINQLNGRWKAQEPRMRQRRDQCLELLRRFAATDLKTQPREESVRILGH